MKDHNVTTIGETLATTQTLPSGNADAILETLLSSGKIDLGDVANAKKIMYAKKYEAMKAYVKEVHPYQITKPHFPREKRWKTYIRVDKTPETPYGRKLLAKTHEKDLYKFLFQHYTGEEFNDDENWSPTLQELYPDWIKYKAQHTNADSYIIRIETDWRTYYLGDPIINIPIRRLKKLTLDEWAHKLIKRHEMTKSQYYNVSLILRQMLNYAVDLEIISSNPFSQVRIDGRRMFRKLAKKPDETQVFSDEEISAITEMAWADFHNPPNRTKYFLAPLALLFQFQTGLRIGELCAVRYEDLISEDTIHIQRMLRRDTHEVVNHTKTDSGDREVYLTQKAQQIIQTCRDYQMAHGMPSDGFIFSTTSEALPETTVDYLYRKYCKKMGIPRKSSHKARKTFISSLIDAQVNINTVRRLAGHEDEKTTLKCYVFDRSTETERRKKLEMALNY